MTEEFLFYDLETWSLYPPGAWLVECAWQRTNSNFEAIEPPVRLVCKPPPDCVPQADAMLVHGKTPQWAVERGISEYQLASRVFAEFNRPNTCVIGYNNLRFDDECIRYLLYRNLFHPYTHQYKNGNSRWDVYDLTLIAYALRPEVINWPENSLKLEDLTRANNFAHNAHDALSDVQTTIALIAAIKKANPRLVDYAFEHSRAPKLNDHVEKFLGNVCLHVSPRIPRDQGHLGLVYPVCRNPDNPKQLYAVDLNNPVDMLLEESAEIIRQLVFSRRDEVPRDLLPPRVKIIHLNRAALLLDPKLLTNERAAQLGIDIKRCFDNYQRLSANALQLQQKLMDVFADDGSFGSKSADVNADLYKGFISDMDYRMAGQLHAMPIEQWGSLRPQWRDSRMEVLWGRVLARENQGACSGDQLDSWQDYLRRCLGGQIDNIPGVVLSQRRVDELIEDDPNNDNLHQLRDYLQGMSIP